MESPLLKGFNICLTVGKDKQLFRMFQIIRRKFTLRAQHSRGIARKEPGTLFNTFGEIENTLGVFKITFGVIIQAGIGM